MRPANGKSCGGGNTGHNNGSHTSSRITSGTKCTTEKSQPPGSNLVVVKKYASDNKGCMNLLSGSHDNLSNTGVTSSVRRKISAPSKTHGVGISGLRFKSETPIRTVNKENILAAKVFGSAKKAANIKSSNIGNMRRAASKESIDSNGTKEREKENVGKPYSGRNQMRNNNCATILQLEKEKAVLEHQISELVRNAESKKAEIATLKMEINRLKDLQCDEVVQDLRQELEALQTENQSLKDRLMQMGVPVEMAALSDNEKEQLLLRHSAQGSMTSLDGSRKISGQASPLPGPSNMEKSSDQNIEVEAGEASGVTLPPAGRPLSEWDKASSSSEMSVACLQDRIMQMEETHHSTNEELQATLQELTDLQDQLTDFQIENDRMGDEKAVLLESLCSQTEKLEECRATIASLQQLLYQQYDENGGTTLNATEREQHLVDLLKKAHEEHDMLLMKQEELTAAVQAAKEEALGHQSELIVLRDRVCFMESSVESVNADKRLLETKLNEGNEKLSASQIDISQLKLQLENEQQKVLDMQKEREASATSELDDILRETRKEKEKVEEKVVRLQEQIALGQRESARLKDQLNQMQEENMVAKNNARKQLSDMEYSVEQLEADKEQIQRERALLEDALQEAELKCHRHLEDKRELKANVGELQKAVNDISAQLKESLKELDEIKKKHIIETEEWNRFQADLLTTVRVANDFKTEAQQDVDKLITENKQLREKMENLESEIEKSKVKQEMSPTQTRSVTLRSANNSYQNSDVTVLNSVEKDLATTRLQLNSAKWGEYRGATQMSVRSLIETIENATKQAKGQGPASSRSSSTSSINSIASETRSTSSLILGNNNDIFIKSSLRPISSDTSCLIRDNKANSPSSRLQRNSYQEGSTYNKSSTSTTSVISTEPTVTTVNKTEMDQTKPVSQHMSILASKLDSVRRNSYGDMVDKKDPLIALVKGGGSKRNALLKWCQNKSIGYKGIDITNFSSSWNDGLAFCALLHSYLPHQIPYHTLDSKDKRQNFTIAFQAAESVGIPTTLNINDLISQERPDWQSIMSYVTSIYKHFET